MNRNMLKTWSTRSGVVGLGSLWLASLLAAGVCLWTLAHCNGSGHGPPTCGMVWATFALFACGATALTGLASTLWGWLGFEIPSWRPVVAAVLAPAVGWGIYELTFIRTIDHWGGLWDATLQSNIVAVTAVLWSHGLAVAWALVNMIREAFGRVDSDA